MNRKSETEKSVCIDASVGA